MARPTAEERVQAVAYDIVAPRSRWTTKWLPDGDYVWADDAVRIAEQHAAAETEALRAEVRQLRGVVYQAHRDDPFDDGWCIAGYPSDLTTPSGAPDWDDPEVQRSLPPHCKECHCPDCAAHRAGEGA